MIKIEYLQQKKGAYYWTPSPKLRAAGWPSEALGHDRAAAIARAEHINAQVRAWKDGAAAKAAAKADGRRTVNDLIVDYRMSRHYTERRPSTRQGYDWCLIRIAEWFGDRPASAITPPAVEKIYSAMHRKTPAFANGIFRVLRLLLSHAERCGDIAKGSNPCKGMKMIGTKPSGRVWSRAAVEAIAAAADALGRPSIGTAVLINAWIGQRPGDILAMTRGDYRDGVLHILQSKTGARVEIPVHMNPALSARLAAEIARQDAGKIIRLHKTAGRAIIASEATGRAYTSHNFSHWFADVRAAAAAFARTVAGDDALAAELERIQFKHLRHTAATRLAEAGSTTPEIASITGHSIIAVDQILERYLVRTASLATNAFARRLQMEQAR